MNLKKHSQTLSSWTGRLVACLLPLLLTLTASAGEQLYFYHTDHLGTPQVMTDDQGQVVWEGHYRPFGEVELTVEGVESNLRFPGQYYDEETNSHYNYFRDYDPTTGRFLQSDPIGLDGGLNTYIYVGNNPTNYYDPLGLCRITAHPGHHIGGRPCTFPGGGGVSGGSRGGSVSGGGRVTPVPIPVPAQTEQCDEEDERCKEVYEQCADECADIFADNPDSLPGMGTDYGSRIRRCIADCVRAAGCSPSAY